MKSMIFEIRNEHITQERNTHSNSTYDYVFKIYIPILPAFSVDYFTLTMHGVTGMTSGNDEIDGTTIIMETDLELTDEERFIIENSIPIVTLHYHGIRDYSLLFPWISDRGLKERIGNFYEECEKSFEQGAWLSFSLMCGAVFEGMLYAKMGLPRNNNTFREMINSASEARIIDLKQKTIMNKVRNLRNLVHGNKYSTPYVTRKEAMDMRNTLDKLIKSFSY